MLISQLPVCPNSSIFISRSRRQRELHFKTGAVFHDILINVRLSQNTKINELS